MIEVQEMANSEIEDLLVRIGYGHLACAENDRPYIVPIHYVYSGSKIYFYTTEGKKTEIIRNNPKVCLQVEEVVDNGEWRSVIVDGDAEQITNGKEREEVIELIRERNPTLTPAISIRWMDDWIRENIEVIYRITPDMMTGLTSLKVRINAAVAQPAGKRTSEVL